uniref:Anoctamin n=1 Tax=Macrostomum lignano TaxID=282301 RepID=A0A1I8I4N5_9PLAT
TIESLRRLVAGSAANQAAACNEGHLCDCLNSLLRGRRRGQELRVLRATAGLVTALLGPEVAAAPALDAGCLSDAYVECYLRRQSEPEAEPIGFEFYHAYLRLRDLCGGQFPAGRRLATASPAELREARAFYHAGSDSVELLMSGQLHRVHFPLADRRRYLRQEIQDRFKYEVDRSSPKAKLRDFAGWLKAIAADVTWQRRLCSNRLGRVFVRGFKAFNGSCIFLSMLVCIVILVSWTEPDSLSDNVPRRPYVAIVATWLLGALHNVFSACVMIGHFLCSRPRVPTLWHLRTFWPCRFGVPVAQRFNGDARRPSASKLQASIFNFNTFYYIGFFLLSALLFYGYFFAVHLLDIARHNQILSRVIRAVTKN